MTEDAVVRIDGDLMKQVREYTNRTGVPGRYVVDTALKHWLNHIAPKILEAMGIEPLTPIFPAQAGYAQDPKWALKSSENDPASSSPKTPKAPKKN